MDCIPTDVILDRLAPQIGQVFFQLGVELGLPIATLENIQNDTNHRLPAQNWEVLFTWRKDNTTVKPTIRVLLQALVNIRKGARCLEEIMKDIDKETPTASLARNIEGKNLPTQT